jgi:two-component system LytT family response regulator
MKKLRVFLVDDEPLALKRLSRLLFETGRVEIAGQATEPLKALEEINKIHLDAIFLDIQMPELSGFELLRKLENYPPVIFTTAFDRFALEAFEVYSVDYLLKPVEAERLAKAIQKLEKLTFENRNETAKLQKLLEAMTLSSGSDRSSQIDSGKIASRIGGRVLILDLSNVACFTAEDKLTFAQNLEGKRFPVDFSLSELEKKLGKHNFLRVHRNALININFIEEVHGWFSGRVLVNLKGHKKTSVVVARDRVKLLREFLDI